MNKKTKVLVLKLNNDLIQKLKEKGYETLIIGETEVNFVEDFNSIDEKIKKINEYEWILFTSRNAVKKFAERCIFLGEDLSNLKPKIAAVGLKTAQELSKINMRVDFIPTAFTTENLAKELPANKGDKLLLIRSKIAYEKMEEILKSRGFLVDSIRIYDVKFKKVDYIADEVLKCKLIVLTSASSVKALFKLLDDETVKKLKENCDVACIGPITAKAALDMGFKVTIVPKRYTIDDLIDEIEKNYG
ncbi:MAG: uroporphyrinogen-III synthase [Thermoproteota archaeon]|jgi:Uroporphyrinogen-III synthase